MTTGRLRWGGNCGPILDCAPWDMPETINRWLAAVYPADRLAVRDVLDELLATRQPVRAEYRLLRPDGQARLVAGHAAFVADATVIGSVARAGGATSPVWDVAATDEDWSAVGYPARHDRELAQFFDLSGDLTFVSLFLAEVDLTTREVAYAGSGHAGYVFRAAGDIAVLFTDGVVEAMSPAGEQFGLARALDVVRRCRTAPAREIVHTLFAAITVFTDDQPLADDVTVIVLKAL